MRGLIVAMSPDRVIGLGGKIPWYYKGDLRRFKRLTMGAVVVMGRRTWESIGSKPLPGRRNIVITSDVGENRFADIPSALASCEGDVWFIGGARIYEEAMQHVDILDVTLVPDHIDDPDVVRFPVIDSAIWGLEHEVAHEDEPLLRRQIFTRRVVS